MNRFLTMVVGLSLLNPLFCRLGAGEELEQGSRMPNQITSPRVTVETIHEPVEKLYDLWEKDFLKSSAAAEAKKRLFQFKGQILGEYKKNKRAYERLVPGFDPNQLSVRVVKRKSMSGDPNWLHLLLVHPKLNVVSFQADGSSRSNDRPRFRQVPEDLTLYFPVPSWPLIKPLSDQITDFLERARTETSVDVFKTTKSEVTPEERFSFQGLGDVSPVISVRVLFRQGDYADWLYGKSHLKNSDWRPTRAEYEGLFK